MAKVPGGDGDKPDPKAEEAAAIHAAEQAEHEAANAKAARDKVVELLKQAKVPANETERLELEETAGKAREQASTAQTANTNAAAASKDAEGHAEKAKTQPAKDAVARAQDAAKRAKRRAQEATEIAEQLEELAKKKA